MKLADCTMEWKDTHESYDVTIQLSLDYDDNIDDDIFFYCKDEEELNSLTKEDNGEDFVIKSINFIYEQNYED